MAQERPRRVLVGATGSVASVKLPELVQQLLAVQTQQVSAATVPLQARSKLAGRGTCVRYLVPACSSACTYTNVTSLFIIIFYLFNFLFTFVDFMLCKKKKTFRHLT